MTYARKVDKSQAEIVKALRAVGISVMDLSRVGHGRPDLLLAARMNHIADAGKKVAA